MPRGDKPTTTAFALKLGWVYEDMLPQLSDAAYRWWYEESLVLDGVRMGPPIFATNGAAIAPQTCAKCRHAGELVNGVCQKKSFVVEDVGSSRCGCHCVFPARAAVVEVNNTVPQISWTSYTCRKCNVQQHADGICANCGSSELEEVYNANHNIRSK